MIPCKTSSLLEAISTRKLETTCIVAYGSVPGGEAARKARLIAKLVQTEAHSLVAWSGEFVLVPASV